MRKCVGRKNKSTLMFHERIQRAAKLSRKATAAGVAGERRKERRRGAAESLGLSSLLGAWAKSAN